MSVEVEMDSRSSENSEKQELELQTLGYGTSTQVAGEDIQDDKAPLEKEEEEEEEEDQEKRWFEKLFRPLCPWLPWTKFRRRKKKDKNRGEWDNRIQFILTLVGYAVGLGNVWRFPYLCARNGGAAFIIPYLIMLFVLGIPLFYLETTFGQLMRSGPITAWKKLVPNLWGIGLASVIVTIYIDLYYNVIMGWVIFYFFSSFQDPLPWGKCANFTITTNVTLNNLNLQTFVGSPIYPDMVSCFNDSTRYYWYTEALGASTSINIAESFNWKIFLSLAAAWVVTYLCMFRGIEWTGKVVYFSATFPYIVLIIMFFRAVTLEGAGEGIKFLFVPGGDEIASKLFAPQVWLEAATQIFFSLGLSLGAIIALSSYTKPSNNTLTDSLVVCFTNSFTSIFASIIVFSIIGFRSHIRNVPITTESVTTGPGLAFIVFSEALTLLPGSPFWALLFFIMLFLLGLDSQFASLEALLAALYDVKSIAKFRKEIVSGVVCLGMFLLSLPYVLGNGVYLFELADQFAGTIPLLVIGFLEIITISWVYGVEKFFSGTKTKVHKYMQFFWWIVWSFISPLAMLIILLGSFVIEILKPLEYSVYGYANEDVGSGGGVRTESKVPYPNWAQFIGAVIVLSSVLSIPTVLIVRLIAFHEARQQALDFFQEKKEQVLRFYRLIRSVSFRRVIYAPHVDEEEERYTTDESGQIPYVSAVDSSNETLQNGAGNKD